MSELIATPEVAAAALIVADLVVGGWSATASIRGQGGAIGWLGRDSLVQLAPTCAAGRQQQQGEMWIQKTGSAQSFFENLQGAECRMS